MLGYRLLSSIPVVRHSRRERVSESAVARSAVPFEVGHLGGDDTDERQISQG
jgi:hypothetical protein